jgi:hypothetical protein
MVLDPVLSIHSKRNYAKALDDLFVFCASRPLSRALLMGYRGDNRPSSLSSADEGRTILFLHLCAWCGGDGLDAALTAEANVI